MKKYILSFIICFSFFSNISVGSTDSLRIVELEIEIDKLEEKVTTLNEVNNKILKSVYFTVGAIITVLLGLGLLTYFTNLKINNKKFGDLSSDLQNKISTQTKTLSSEVKELLEKSNQSSKKLIENSIKTKLESQKNETKSLKKNMYINRVAIRDLITNKEYNSNQRFGYLNEFSNLNNNLANLKLEIEIDNGIEIMHRLKIIEKIIDDRKISLEDKETLEKVFHLLPKRFIETGNFIKEKINLSGISDY